MKVTVRELVANGGYRFFLDGEELITQLDVESVQDTTYASLILHDMVILSKRATNGGRLSFDIPYELHLGGTVFCESAIPGEWEFRWKKTFATFEEWSSLTSAWRDVQVLSLPLGAACTWRVERIPLEGKS